MNVVFLSNYFNHHQKPLSDALAGLSDYTFIATAEMTEERRKMGWGYDTEPAYVCRYAQEPQRAEQAMARADVVIAGSAPQHMVCGCIRRGQLVFRYSERPLKNGKEWLKYLPRLLKWHILNPMGRRVYLLCASAYTAGDYARFGLFRNRAYRWGYFPEVKRYPDIGTVLDQKEMTTILWAGRFVSFKHPEDVVYVAKKLKAENIRFRVQMIGGGPMERQLRDMIAREGLEDCVQLLGMMPPETVRAHMERAGIFLFTSDEGEGWGAVLNEAMNSGCGVVASRAAGATDYLIRPGENGCTYRFGDSEGLYTMVKKLLDDPSMTQTLGARAYRTMTEQWNGQEAASRLILLAERILAGEKNPEPFPDGPCSKETR